MAETYNPAFPTAFLSSAKGINERSNPFRLLLYIKRNNYLFLNNQLTASDKVAGFSYNTVQVNSI